MQHLKFGKWKFGIHRIGCSMSWMRYKLFMSGSCHLDRLWKLLLNIKTFSLLCFSMFFCEMHFWATSRSRKGWVISLKKPFQSSKTQKVNKHFKIWLQFYHLMACPNGMIHKLTLSKNCSVKTWMDLKQLEFSKSWKFCSETALRTSSTMMSWPELSFGCSSGPSALLAPDTYPCVKGEQKNHGCNAMQAKKL